MSKTRQEKLIDFFEKNGMSPKSNISILEIGANAENSLTRFLDEYYPYTFLLSKDVDSITLEKYNLDGAYGWIDEEGLCVPQTRENEHLKNSNGKFDIPKIEDFDTIVCETISDDLFQLAYLEKMNIFLGNLKLKNSKKILNNYKEIKDALNSISELNGFIPNYDLVTDENEKEFAIIRRK